MAHNGNVVNYVPLKKEVENQGGSFETECDVEIILQLVAQTLSNKAIDFENICETIKKVHSNVLGSYSVVGIITGKGMIAFRDPRGIRPLLFGKRQDGQAYAFASETNALRVFGCHEISDVQPGEVIFINNNLQIDRREITSCRPAHCSFEFNYFCKPNTQIENREVYSVRSRLGELLADKIKEAKIDADVVVPIPTTARSAAIALSRALGINYDEGFVKQDHIGRTFIMPTQGVRKQALFRKLTVVPSVFRDKKVILVDDSIVRGTVSKRVVALARWAGAKKVYFASTFPPIRHPCLYGIDFPHQDQLIATGKTIAMINEEIQTDDLVYNDVEALKAAIGTDDLCTACLTGEYPTSTEGKEELQNLRQKDLEEIGAFKS